MQLIHHGGHEGVTGSCHQLQLDDGRSLLVDCGIFQGDDARGRSGLEIEFPLDGIEALILTHVHIDHVGRLPYLVAAGFQGPIYCSRPSARLLPLVIEDAEAQQLLRYDDQPLVFDNLTTVGDHDEHRSTLDYLKKSGIPAIIIAGSGMCTGGRVVNYLKAFIDRENTDVLFVGYQGRGTPGRTIQQGRDTVDFDGQEYAIRAEVHGIGGYSAHADQRNLLDFVEGMPERPGEIVLVHGEQEAKATLKGELESRGYAVS